MLRFSISTKSFLNTITNNYGNFLTDPEQKFSSKKFPLWCGRQNYRVRKTCQLSSKFLIVEKEKAHTHTHTPSPATHTKLHSYISFPSDANSWGSPQCVLYVPICRVFSPMPEWKIGKWEWVEILVSSCARRKGVVQSTESSHCRMGKF